jgi:hypothetical protein
MSGKVLTVDNSVSTTDDRHTHGLGMQIDDSLTVILVGEGGQAIAGGVEVGDKITAMNGESMEGKSDIDAVSVLTSAKANGQDCVVEFNGGIPPVIVVPVKKQAPPPAPAPAPAEAAMEAAGDDLTKFKMTLIRGYEVQVNAGLACCGPTLKVLFMKPEDATNLYIATTKTSTSCVDTYAFANIKSIKVGEHKSGKIIEITKEDGSLGFFTAPNPSSAAKFAKYLGQLTK